MPYGFPNISYIGYPVSVPCAPHAGLGFREAKRPDAPEILGHLKALDPLDRRHRFCATVDDSVLDRHVEALWTQDRVVLAAHDGPLWGGPMHRAGPVRALAELVIGNGTAEIALTVDGALRRRGVGTYLVQTAAFLLRRRGIPRVEAYTLPGNVSFLTLAAKCGASVARTPDDVEIVFDVEGLAEALDPSGQLLVRTQDGVLRAMSAGEVSTHSLPGIVSGL